MYTNVLNLEESADGNRIKQGDLSVMSYILTDANNDDLQLDGKQAKVYLTDVDGVKYIDDTTVKEQDGKYLCDVVIDKIIPAGTYTLEIWVDETYCFPSDRKSKVKVEPSVLGNELGKINTENMYEKVIEYAKTHNLIKDGENGVDGKDGIDGANGQDGKSFTPSDLTDEDYKKILDYAISHEYFKQEPIDTSKIEIGKEEPEDKTKIWIDTNGGNE
ncbi:hypothetical protein [Staphylococcus epidermidis]|uniref:hypothetical protein n=1 Tax=Staphylococcus epidermidis TaxID=1282 RepID=UPI00026C2186|nr:hypothetical protein [Staphylococcus epidermidis]EJE08134.1 hypothetical protein HMPREF9982_06541 [Staphylococcus epidermidis NIHLM021]MDS3967071.1 hypothetical protein [Staphylococcus epidermidis]